MNNHPLDGISIASPCSADWNQMAGDERRRFCADCKLHVHNLSGMSQDEALSLLQQAGQGRVCVRFFRRADGTVLTRDCPVGLRQKLRRAWARAGALWLLLCSQVACGRQAAPPTAGPQVEPSGSSGQERPLQGEVMMGDMVAPPRPEPMPVEPPAIMGKVRAPDRPNPNK